ncbi:MAG: MBL fold metallo-hydrolase [Stenotrophobium sp.]
MAKWQKRFLWTVIILAALLVPAYYELVLNSPSEGADYSIDIAKVRALANSIPGDKSSEIRYERIMNFRFAEAMVAAGDPWRWTLLPVYSYQLVFPDQTLIVDTAMPRSMAGPDFMVRAYDDAAYQRMDEVMDKASQIVVTHEHMDHIGGLAAHPHLAALLPAVRLTAEQFANPEGMKPAVWPAGVMKNYQPIHYAKMLVIAPGVVLIKAPGHTPGSQMVYVQRADGRELLFLGDVAWHMRSIELVRERPLFMTLIIGENRQQVLGEFKALHALMQTDPSVHLVPGHDGEVVKALSDQGLLTQHFKL